MKKVSKSWMLGGLAAAGALLLSTGAAQAALISTYTYGGNNISVFTLGDWGGAAPGGAENISLNQAFGGSWTVPAGVTSVKVLVVGGGGGSDGWSGGGGAGGMYYTGSYGVTPGAGMTVTVGAGGAEISGDIGGMGNGGGQSQFGTQLIAYGGNAGADYNTPYGGDQGGYSLDGGVTPVPGNAFVGRTAYGPSYPYWGWFSGSGAGAAGLNGEPAIGGIGLQCDITGENLYYAGGGGFATVGGLGGGGTSVAWGNATDGVDGLGGGAGGGYGGGNNGANGGDGVVIVAYAIPEPASFGMLGVVGVAMLLRRKLRG